MRNEREFRDQRPPKQILIFSNFERKSDQSGIPFEYEYVYLTFDCKNLPLLDDINLEVRATAHFMKDQQNIKKKTKASAEKKPTVS